MIQNPFYFRFFLESYTKYAMRNYSKILFPKIKFKHISGSIGYRFIQFFKIVCQVDNYRNILKLNWRPLAFISCKAFSNVWNAYVSVLLTSQLIAQLPYWAIIFAIQMMVIYIDICLSKIRCFDQLYLYKSLVKINPKVF